MLSEFISLLVGIFLGILLIFILLLKWNPTSLIDQQLEQARKEKVRKERHEKIAKELQHQGHGKHAHHNKNQHELTEAEQRQKAFFALAHLSSSSSSTLSLDDSTESTRWLNTILSYIFTHISTLANEAASDGRLEEMINEKILSKIKYPHFVSPVIVSDLSIGTSLPTIHSITLLQTDYSQPLIFDITLSYNGGFYVCVESGLGLNSPIVNLAVLPIELALKDFACDEIKLRVQIDASELPVLKCMISIRDTPTPHFDFQLHSHIGSSLILSDLHILQTIFQRVIQEVMYEKIIEPNAVEVEVKLW